jgi:hypothetical protein
VTKPFVLDGLGLSSSEEQIPQVVETLESGGKPREALETVGVLERQRLLRKSLITELIFSCNSSN